MFRIIIKPLAVGVLLGLTVAAAVACPHRLRDRRMFVAPLAVPSATATLISQGKPPPATPAALEPPVGNVLLFELRAEGFQIYECKPKKGAVAEFEWAPKAPDAILYDERGEKAGTHGVGPSWTASDGSKVVAAKTAESPAPGGRAVAWLLLRAKANEGTGVFGKVTYIQRVDTWAGAAPSTGAAKESAGKELRVKYQATYRFFGAAR